MHKLTNWTKIEILNLRNCWNKYPRFRACRSSKVLLTEHGLQLKLSSGEREAPWVIIRPGYLFHYLTSFSWYRAFHSVRQTVKRYQKFSWSPLRDFIWTRTTLLGTFLNSHDSFSRKCLFCIVRAALRSFSGKATDPYQQYLLDQLHNKTTVYM